MGNQSSGIRPQALERWSASVGFVLAGIVMAVTGASYIANSPFSTRWLVWLVGLAFVGVGLISVEWARATTKATPTHLSGKLRLALAAAIPIAFLADSQICGLGLAACNDTCHVISYVTLALGVLVGIRAYHNRSVGALLAPMVVIGLLPHCTCHAPINTWWHDVFAGSAPTCQVMPLAVALFGATALRGIRPRLGAGLAIMVLVVIVFIAVGNPLLGFPWQGCVG